jgi:hypothetical protein
VLRTGLGGGQRKPQTGSVPRVRSRPVGVQTVQPYRRERSPPTTGDSGGPDGRGTDSHTQVEVHLVQAETALQADDPKAGRVAMADRSDLARPSASFVRRRSTLALAVGLTGEFLRSSSPAGVGTQFAQRLSDALHIVHSEIPAPLSERELAVLALLPPCSAAARSPTSSPWPSTPRRATSNPSTGSSASPLGATRSGWPESAGSSRRGPRRT